MKAIGFDAAMPWNLRGGNSVGFRFTIPTVLATFNQPFSRGLWVAAPVANTNITTASGVYVEDLATFSGITNKYSFFGVGATDIGHFGGPMETKGPFTFTTDNATDIGAAGATRPRRVYVGTDFVGPIGATTPNSGNFTALTSLSGAVNATIGAGTANTGAFTTISATGQITSTLATGTAPFSVASTTNVANLNSATLNGATFASPGPIGSTTPSTGAFTTISATGQITSTLATGTAPFSVSSTTNVANLNAATLNGATFAIPGAIGGTTPSTGAFTTLSVTGQFTSTLASGTTPFVFNVTLSAASSLSVTVNYATLNGTATSARDYQSTSGTLTFAAGQTSKTITVLVNGDTTKESNETFAVRLSNPSNATITKIDGIGTIIDDD